ncbi:hypothetical protein GF361_00175 [Candidatus Woesearchaeota archaeon]|nr:hypothetical protein [Candidatus Woesearchaeota archaeon]
MSFEHKFKKQLDKDLDDMFYELFNNATGKNHGIEQIKASFANFGKTDDMYKIVTHNWSVDPNNKLMQKNLAIYKKELEDAYNTLEIAAKDNPHIVMDPTFNTGVHLRFNFDKVRHWKWRFSCNVKIEKINLFITHLLNGLKIIIKCPKCKGKLDRKTFVCEQCGHTVAFEFKTWYYGNCELNSLIRRDKLVFYLPNEELIGDIYHIMKKLKKYLDPDTPKFLKEIVPGCGFGPDKPNELVAAKREEYFLNLGGSFTERFCLIIVKYLHKHIVELQEEIQKNFIAVKDEKGLYKYLRTVFLKVKLDVLNDKQVKEYIRIVSKLHEELEHMT